MPELPEVETIKLGLQKKIIGLTIKKVDGIPGIVGKKVISIRRFSKLLIIDLTGDISLAIHLRMTGQLIYDDGKRFIGGHPTPDMRDQMPNKTTRIIFEFSDGSKLYFNDQRKFGFIKALKTDEVEKEKYVEGLGPEPLEKGFTWQILKSNILKHKSQPVKVALMDQTVVSGVGNIYANESCFLAKIDPRKKVADLTDEDIKSLHQGVLKALKDGIKYGGSSRAHFVDPDGHKGYYLDYAFVYFRASHPCKICKTEIKKIQLGGRGTYFCPSCQSQV